MDNARRRTPLPSRWLLWFFRLPNLVYRVGFPGYERLFGARWILLTTRGRRSGRPRSVMLDLVGHDPVTDRYYIQPGWGRSCNWVRNIEADPRVEAQVGRKRFQARAVDVSGPEGADWLLRFMKAHPIQSYIVGKFVLGLDVRKRSEEETREWLAKEFLVYALDPVQVAAAASSKSTVP